MASRDHVDGDMGLSEVTVHLGIHNLHPLFPQHLCCIRFWDLSLIQNRECPQNIRVTIPTVWMNEDSKLDMINFNFRKTFLNDISHTSLSL